MGGEVAAVEGKQAWGWGLAGLILILLHGVLLGISHEFVYGRPILERPTGLMVVLLVVCGLIYLGALFIVKPPSRPNWRWWVWMGAVGLTMRLLMFPSSPMLEDDAYRYLWDGALVAHGHNPYTHAPSEAQRGDVPEGIAQLATASGIVVDRVNHPELRTIYPPVAQAGFAIAHLAAPWRFEGLRLVWLAFDAVSLALVVALLGALGLPKAMAAAYWWNPLLVKEAYNSGHMELIIVPFVIGGLLLAVRGRWALSGGALALGLGAKVWPVLLLPIVARQQTLRWPQWALLAFAFAVPAAIVSAPVLLSGFDGASGFRAYAERWRMNDSLHQLIYWASAAVVPENARAVSRSVSGLLVLVCVALLCRKPALDGRAMCERGLWAVAALFLLSPTQFPWYYLWLLPLLTIRFSPGLLVLTATLPLYYLRFPMAERGYEAWFFNGVVWLQFGPSLVLLAWEAWREWGARPRPNEGGGADHAA